MDLAFGWYRIHQQNVRGQRQDQKVVRSGVSGIKVNKGESLMLCPSQLPHIIRTSFPVDNSQQAFDVKLIDRSSVSSHHFMVDGSVEGPDWWLINLVLNRTTSTLFTSSQNSSCIHNYKTVFTSHINNSDYR